MKNIKTIGKNLIWITKNLIYCILTIIPVNKKMVIFESYLGQSFSGSPKYIYLKLREYDIKREFKYVWTFDNPNEFKEMNTHKNIILVKTNSLKHYYYLSRAKFWVRNSESIVVMRKRSSTIYIQTWHGTPIKKMFYDDINFINSNCIFMYKFKRAIKNWTYFIAPNKYTEEIFSKFFEHNIDIIKIGYPRNDLLINSSDKVINNIKSKYKIKNDKKIILYAPTFRDYEYNQGMSSFKFKLDFNLINNELKDYIIIVRAHYYVSKLAELDNFDNVYNFSDPKYDIQELYVISDILITDYSSVMFDYAYTKKPILLYTYDYEKYKSTRGNYFDLTSNSPGPLLYNTNEILDTIQNIDKVKLEYENQYNLFFNKFCNYPIGNSSKYIIDIILGNIKSKGEDRG